MDPCPFVRLIIESLALKLPLATKPAGSGVHPSATPCFCKLRIKNFPSQTALIPLCSTDSASSPDTTTSATGFHLDASVIRRLSAKPTALHVEVYTGRMGRTCGVNGGKLLGKVQVSIELGNAGVTNSRVFQNGWLNLGNQPDKPAAKLHIVVRSEPDPRFIFQFGGEPECSPVVFQIQGNIRQPVFSCKFSADRNSRTRSLPSDFTLNGNRGWRSTFSSEKERPGRERKGWMIMIYDLSGSPVAAASIITPFVPSPGTDRVSRSNPGAWLILRPNGFSVSNWKPWGRLEAWRERGPIDGLGYKFELVIDNGGPSRGIPIAEATMSSRKGGEFCIDSRVMKDSGLMSSRSPVKGFVMGATVEGEGKISKPVVQVGVQHVTCMADAALFVAVSAAIDLSMDACRLFSHKLRKELCYDEQDWFS
ncbi:uncharacterized protein LOC126666852 [Mercurialis annua]|uniref:uncharacterized protein LOC126666852 n=1 Tax=Mercurialis annua TaxID=3986 RepID=UPI002160B2B6|nr:uncharacterized protein LOC126666852 [Mercurialis annua]